MPKFLFAMIAAFACACGSTAKTSPPPTTNPPLVAPPPVQAAPPVVTLSYDETVSIRVGVPSADWTVEVNENMQSAVDLRVLLTHRKIPDAVMAVIAAGSDGYTEEQAAGLFRMTDEEAAQVGTSVSPIVMEDGRAVLTMEKPVDGVPTRLRFSVFRLAADSDVMVVVIGRAPTDAWSEIEGDYDAFVGSIQPHAP